MKIIRGKFNPIPSTYSRSLHELVNMLLLKDHKKRPGIEEILKSQTLVDKMKLYGYQCQNEAALKIKAQP